MFCGSLSSMETKEDVKLKNFFIFNSLFGPKEGEELKKVLYYHPITDITNVQIKHVGLVEGIINFTKTFSPCSDVSSLHTNKTRQLYFQPEKNFWVVMTIDLPSVIKNKENSNSCEYVEAHVQDNIYEAVLKQSYYIYRLFWGSFQSTVDEENVSTLKTRLEVFFDAYLMSLKLSNSDVLSVFSGIQYLPLDKQTFLKVQCFINAMESSYDCIQYTAFLYNDYLIWSGLEPFDMQIVYQYLIGTLLPANVESELQGGSITLNCPSTIPTLRHGRFIMWPSNLKITKNAGKVPKMFLFSSGHVETCQMVVYRALSVTVCLFIKGNVDIERQFFKDLSDYMAGKLPLIVSDIAEYCTNQVITPATLPENSPRFIYFNKLNQAYKSTAHLDNKQKGNIACTPDSLRIVADMNSRNHFLGHSGETIVKTINDYWVIGKTSNYREFYIVLQQKNSCLIEISEKVKKMCETELQGIFFHRM